MVNELQGRSRVYGRPTDHGEVLYKLALTWQNGCFGCQRASVKVQHDADCVI